MNGSENTLPSTSDHDEADHSGQSHIKIDINTNIAAHNDSDDSHDSLYAITPIDDIPNLSLANNKPAVDKLANDPGRI